MEQKRKYSLVILSVLFLLSAGLTVGFGWNFMRQTIHPMNEMTQQSNKVATFLANYYLTATANPSSTPTPTPTNTPSHSSIKLLPPTSTPIPTPTLNPHAEELEHALALVEIDFPAWQSLNGDVQAWVYNKAIRVDHPVLKSPDNEYYLTHDVDHSPKAMGSIFFDFRNHTDFTDSNTIIYGHNFDNGLMFSNLVWYKSQQYFEQNPYYYLYTPEQVFRVDISAGIVVSETDTTYLVVGFDSERAFRNLIQTIEENSVIDTGVSLTTRDRLVTLYTCTNDWQGQRFVVIGKLTPLGAFTTP